MMGISQIIMSLSYKKGPCISSVDMLLCALNISVARTYKFLVCMVTDPSFTDNSAKRRRFIIIKNPTDCYSSNDYGTSIQVNSS